MIILGIDPGSSRIGFCVLKKESGISLVKSGVIDISPRHQHEKIRALSEHVELLLKKFHPDLASIEKLYFAKNKKTAIEVAEAIGVIKHLLIARGIPVREYTPPQIKQSVTGYGNADKRGVAKMSKLLLQINDIPGPDDVTDAVAVALTAAFEMRGVDTH